MAREVAAPGTGTADAEIDVRSVPSNRLRRTLNMVHPDHWSFLLGEIALCSFIVLLLSGTYLTFFFDASMREVTYEESYAPLRGVEVSAAYDAWHRAGCAGPRPKGRLRVHPRRRGGGTLRRWMITPVYGLVYDRDGRPWRIRLRLAF